MSREKLKNYISDLYYDGKKSFHHMNHEEKATATSLLMNTLNNHDRVDFITQTCLLDDLADSLSNYLGNFEYSNVDNYEESKTNLLSTICAGATSFAEKSINKLFEEEVERELFINTYEKGDDQWIREQQVLSCRIL